MAPAASGWPSMVDGSGAADQSAELNSASSTPGDMQTSLTLQQQQHAKPVDAEASSESIVNTATNLVSMTASNTL